MSSAAPSNNGRFDLFAAVTSAEKRIAAGSGPYLKGTARGRMLELVGQLRPELVPKKEEPKAPEKPVEKTEKPKEEKPAAAAENKEAKPAEKKAA